jgi:hypothetical protein
MSLARAHFLYQGPVAAATVGRNERQYRGLTPRFRNQGVVT